VAEIARLGADGLNAAVPAVIYLAAVRRVTRAGGVWPARRTVVFIGALLVAAAAAGGEVDAAARRSLAWHMGQQMTLLVLVPPALLAGRPVTLVRRALGRGVAWVPGPAAAWCVFVGIQWVVHVPAVLELGLRQPAVAALLHWSLVAAGTLFFAQVLDRREPGGMHPVTQALYLVAAMPTTDAIALWLMFDPHVVYGHYAGAGALDEQRLAGAIMFAAGGVLLALAAWVVGRWLRSSASPARIRRPRAAA
jgi:putative membrane protein